MTSCWGVRLTPVPRLQLYVSEDLEARLRERAEVSGVSVSALAGVLLDQALVLYTFPAPASTAEELAGQTQEIARRVREAGLAHTVAEPPDPDAPEGRVDGQADSATPGE